MDFRCSDNFLSLYKNFYVFQEVINILIQDQIHKQEVIDSFLL